MSTILHVDNDELKELLDALESVEWAGVTWTDYPTCPFCGELQEDGGKHTSDCKWFHIMVKWRRRKEGE